MLDEDNVDRAKRAVDLVADAVVRDSGLIVLTGAGTSGRLCWTALDLLAREQPGYLKRFGIGSCNVRCSCSLAGGDGAFKKSIEHAEDDATSAVRHLRDIVAESGHDASDLIVVGVTCGLSATWVASQIKFALDGGGKAILMAFTPLETGRGPFADAAFRDRLANDPNAVVLCPIVGPEIVTGSTRLKSGTATKILLDVILGCGFRAGLARGMFAMDSTSGWEGFLTRDELSKYRDALSDVYQQTHALAAAIEAGGNALRAGGRIVYAGVGRSGYIGIVDASEQLPTFGCLANDFEGFMLDAGALDASVGRLVGERATRAHFLAALETLGPKDVVVLLQMGREIQGTDVAGRAEAFRSKGFTVVCMNAVSISVVDAIDPNMLVHSR